MAKKPETLFQDRIRPLIAGLPKTHVLKIQQVALRGAPDFIAVVNGCSVWMELKRDRRQKAKPLQLYHLRRAESAGAVAMVVCPETWGEAYRFLRRLAETPFCSNNREEVPECLRLPMDK